MIENTLIIISSLSLLAYRVRVLRKRGISTNKALGFALDRRPLLHLGIGTAISAVVISTIFFFERSIGMLSVSSINPITALIKDFETYVAVPLTEEFLFRCAFLGGLLLLIRRPFLAVFISAALFGGLHASNPNASILSVVVTTIGGLAYGIAYLVAERIWFPLGLHFGWNYFEARVFGFSISGGSVRGPAPLVQQHDMGPTLVTGGAYGPEGGIIGLMAKIIVLALVLAWLVFERRKLCENTMERDCEKMNQSTSGIE
jgi:membrane protease YdiL (CAAX protease family)